MKGIGEERGCDEELARGRGTEEQQSTVEGAPFQPQPPFFNEINGSHFVALPNNTSFRASDRRSSEAWSRASILISRHWPLKSATGAQDDERTRRRTRSYLQRRNQCRWS